MIFRTRLDQADWELFNQILQRRQQKSRHGWSTLLPVFLAFGVVGIIVPILSQILGKGSDEGDTVWMIRIYPPVIILAIFVFLKMKTRRIVRNYLDDDGYMLGERTVTAAPDGLRIKTTRYEELVYWPSFVSATLSDRLLLLFVERNIALFFSRAHGTDAEFDAFVSAVRAHAPQLAGDLPE